MKVYPKIGRPKKIVYKNRNKYERNWAFFSEQGDVFAFYWANPLRILKLKKESFDTWDMDDYYCGEKLSDISEDFTIGTQLSRFDDKYYFIGHSKSVFLKKKIYLGRLGVFDFKNKEIRYGNHWLSHSFGSLFGSSIKHNKNLFSCTYFSGLQVFKDSVKIGYGINDIDTGFSTHKLEEL